MSGIRRFPNFSILLWVAFILIMTNTGLNAAAENTAYDDSNAAGYQVATRQTTQLSAATIHYQDNGLTIRDGRTYPQQVNVLTQKCAKDAKLVTWAVKNADGSGYVRQTVAAIASNYEMTHPGWKVVGGVNADQYYPKFGVQGHVDGSDYFYPQPYGCFIADGEKWFSINAKPYGGNGTYLAGFLNNGSSDQILEGRTNWDITDASRFFLSGLYVSFYDEHSKIVKKFKIEKFNEAPGENESSLYSPLYQGTNIPSRMINGNHLFLVGDAEQAYVSNSITYTYKAGYDQRNVKNAQNAFFGKGIISSTGTSATLGKGQFAIDTKNPKILAALQVGARILVQFEYEGTINQVESATAYHTVMRSDDQDVASINAYNSRQYPRVFFGRKADGTMVLMTVDGSQGSKGMAGMNQLEGCAVLKYYEVTEAYQMDGGGSVTMVVREKERFKVVNSPSDGSSRPVLTALLLVIRDAGKF